MPDFRVSIEPGDPKFGGLGILFAAGFLAFIGWIFGKDVSQGFGEFLAFSGGILGAIVGFKIWMSEQ